MMRGRSAGWSTISVALLLLVVAGGLWAADPPTSDATPSEAERSTTGGTPAPVPGAVPIKFDRDARIGVQSSPVKVKGFDLHILSIDTATFHLGNDGRLTAKLKAVVVQHMNVKYWVYAAVFDAQGRLLGTASHEEQVQFISAGRVLTAMRDIDLDFGVSKDFSRAAYVLVTISNPELSAQ